MAMEIMKQICIKSKVSEHTVFLVMSLVACSSIHIRYFFRVHHDARDREMIRDMEAYALRFSSQF